MDEVVAADFGKQLAVVSSRPSSVATDATGTRVYVLLPAEARAPIITEGKSCVLSPIQDCGDCLSVGLA